MATLTAAEDAWLFALGLLLGSFINLAAHRLPRHLSLVRPRSHCPACGRVLNPVDLVPVLGYLARRGRCATCRAPIGPVQPLTELGAGLALGLPALWLGPVRGPLLGLLLVLVLGAARVVTSSRS
ncbi:MAG: prepilin peptidase [Candidatus Dormibacteria bacterium]